MSWREREAARLNTQLEQDTYEQDGALRWKTNGAVVPLHVFSDAGVEPPAAQAAEREKEAALVTAEYRQYREEHGYSAEERAEMRAAFGPGAKVVDVVTGRKVRI